MGCQGSRAALGDGCCGCGEPMDPDLLRSLRKRPGRVLPAASLRRATAPFRPPFTPQSLRALPWAFSEGTSVSSEEAPDASSSTATSTHTCTTPGSLYAYGQRCPPGTRLPGPADGPPKPTRCWPTPCAAA
eukprot:EG_transcript_25652